jgi:UDP-N-acetylmuramate dehydrogenase
MRQLIQKDILLAPYTTLQIGGPARYFAEARSEAEVLEALEFADRGGHEVFIMGGGSNILVADEGFPGLVLRVAIKGIQWFDDGMVIAGAGEDWDQFVHKCVERDLAGVECLSGIPGFTGGTPVQNVGAYGQEISETITSVRVLDRLTGTIVELENSGCRFNYRESIFNTTARDRYIVLAVAYTLRPHGEPAIRYPDVINFFPDLLTNRTLPSLKEVREAVRTIRSRKAMLLIPGDNDCRSAGSFFKNPIVTPEFYARIEEATKAQGLISAEERVPSFSAADGKIKVPAAWLIERAGFHKGYSRGRVGISSKHALAIINRGGATAGEVMDLVGEIRQRVEARFGVHLNAEPVFVGFL